MTSVEELMVRCRYKGQEKKSLIDYMPYHYILFLRNLIQVLIITLIMQSIHSIKKIILYNTYT